MKRLFIALNASDPLEKTFVAPLKKLKMNADRKGLSFRWTPPSNYHVTIQFLGSRPESDIDLIHEAMLRIAQEIIPFELKIEDLGAFSNEFEARVLWLGVQNKKNLSAVREKLGEALRERDLMTRLDDHSDHHRPTQIPDKYVPHITIARLRNPHSVRDMISPFKRKSFGKMLVQEIVLYESIQRGNFTEYVPLRRAQFLGPRLGEEILAPEVMDELHDREPAQRKIVI